MEVLFKNDAIEVEIEGLEMFFAAKRKLIIPVKNIENLSVIDSIHVHDYIKLDAVKIGTYLPDVVAEGTFYENREKVFISAHEGKPAIVLDLINEEFAQVILETDHPQELALQVKQAKAK